VECSRRHLSSRHSGHPERRWRQILLDRCTRPHTHFAVMRVCVSANSNNPGEISKNCDAVACVGLPLRFSVTYRAGRPQEGNILPNDGSDRRMRCLETQVTGRSSSLELHYRKDAQSVWIISACDLRQDSESMSLSLYTKIRWPATLHGSQCGIRHVCRSHVHSP
jgi:hypothetical protein